MPFQRILIAVDGSRGAESALHLGGELAANHDAEVLLVHAVPLPPLVAGVDQAISDESINYLERNAESVVSAAAIVLDDLGVKSKAILQPGSAADIILDVAEHYEVDLIVVGHRGHGRMRRLLMGSVSSKLAHHARCALLLAPVAEE